MARRPPVIDYHGEFVFALSCAELWRSIEHVERFPRWWPWLSDFSWQGTGLRKGTVLRGVVDPPVPYTMRVDVVFGPCRRPRSIDAAIHGDLEGEAHLRLHPQEGGSRAEVHWEVEMMQRPMRIADAVAHPLLRWGHDRVVEMTVAGFRRHAEIR